MELKYDQHPEKYRSKRKTGGTINLGESTLHPEKRCFQLILGVQTPKLLMYGDTGRSVPLVVSGTRKQSNTNPTGLRTWQSRQWQSSLDYTDAF